MITILIFIKYIYIFLFFKFGSSNLSAEKSNLTTYPKGEFIFPIKPGSTASLSGSYGDIRFNHFHAGLDIRTGGVEGVAVHSAGDGYVSRVGVSRGGYGNALYITHPNGFTTVYGHLKEFSSGIKEKLTQRQYQQQAWEIDTYFSPGEILVKKGEVVALSGNTGGSGGPHLHFEIRNQAEETINPALFGFKEVVDNLNPVIEKVVLRPMNIDSRINGQFGEVTLTPIRLKNGDYVLNNRITAVGKIGVMLYTYDKSETSPFRLGVTSLQLTNNGVEQYNFDLEKMVFETKIDMNLHTDYEKMVDNGVKYHKLFVEEGNRLSFYATNQSKGFVDIFEPKNDLEVVIKDTYQNSTSLKFSVVREDVEKIQVSQAVQNYNPKILVDKFNNFLRIQAVSSTPISTPAILQYQGNPKSMDPAYQTANSVVYLYDLTKGLVDFVQIGGASEKIEFNVRLSPELNVFDTKLFNANFGQSIYSDLFLHFNASSTTLNLDEDVYPLKGRFDVSWKTTESLCAKCGVYLASSRPKFQSTDKTNDGVLFTPKEFGTYKILEDDEAPYIKPLKINSSDLSFYIKDNLSGIKNITCFVNNEWTMMEYEPKLNLIWSEKLDPQKPFKGLIQLTVEDNQGNKQTFERTI